MSKGGDQDYRPGSFADPREFLKGLVASVPALRHLLQGSYRQRAFCVAMGCPLFGRSVSCLRDRQVIDIDIPCDPVDALDVSYYS
ncbi:hypothetical protein Ciccas_014375 [Cichlidogyrus casuarinus]|uniref:Uncharacterized protein n=1 Tax=Cichlidogyrus casuarinus TaxID=1844966 RepID=A0ABD2PJ10_9PLAT